MASTTFECPARTRVHAYRHVILLVLEAHYVEAEVAHHVHIAPLERAAEARVCAAAHSMH